MPTPSHYRALAAHVARHRVYYVSAGLGTFVVLFAAGAVLAFLEISLPWYASEIAFWIGYFIVLHWGFLIAWGWFHPGYGALNCGADSGSRFRASLQWPFALFLSLYFASAAVGPLVVWFSGR